MGTELAVSIAKAMKDFPLLCLKLVLQAKRCSLKPVKGQSYWSKTVRTEPWRTCPLSLEGRLCMAKWILRKKAPLLIIYLRCEYFNVTTGKFTASLVAVHNCAIRRHGTVQRQHSYAPGAFHGVLAIINQLTKKQL